MTYDQLHQIMTARCAGDDIMLAAKLRRETEAAVRLRDDAKNGHREWATLLREAA